MAQINTVKPGETFTLKVDGVKQDGTFSRSADGDKAGHKLNGVDYGNIPWNQFVLFYTALDFEVHEVVPESSKK